MSCGTKSSGWRSSTASVGAAQHEDRAPAVARAPRRRRAGSGAMAMGSIAGIEGGEVVALRRGTRPACARGSPPSGWNRSGSGAPPPAAAQREGGVELEQAPRRAVEQPQPASARRSRSVTVGAKPAGQAKWSGGPPAIEVEAVEPARAGGDQPAVLGHGQRPAKRRAWRCASVGGGEQRCGARRAARGSGQKRAIDPSPGERTNSRARVGADPVDVAEPVGGGGAAAGEVERRLARRPRSRSSWSASVSSLTLRVPSRGAPAGR